MRVLLIEDQPQVRQRIRQHIEAKGYTVVAEMDRVIDVVDIAKNTNPDIALIDLRLTVGTGYDVIARLRTALPEVRCVVVSQFGRVHNVVEALAAGAQGYIVKSGWRREWEEALETVMNGGVYVSEELDIETIKATLRDYDHEIAMDQLTPRQRDVLALLAAGNDPESIALTLNIAKGTVQKHYEDIKNRLDVRYIIRMSIWAYNNHVAYVPEL